MSQAGYTLAETLAALLIIGLAFAGLTEGVRVIGLFQTATARTTKDVAALWTSQNALDQLLRRQGPFRSDDPKRLVGDKTGFSFDCGAKSPCGARLMANGHEPLLRVVDSGGEVAVTSLPNVDSASFAYSDSGQVNANWPPSPGERRLLKSIFLVGHSALGDVPLATARLWREQEVDCHFDPIAQDCRTAAP